MLSLEILIRMRKSLYSLGLSDIWHQLPNGVSENKSALLLITLSKKKKKKKKKKRSKSQFVSFTELMHFF